jgi:hypothetical protein
VSRPKFPLGILGLHIKKEAQGSNCRVTAWPLVLRKAGMDAASTGAYTEIYIQNRF